MISLASLELDVPIVLAPMAGGPSTPRLAAAVCEAGGLGSIGVAYTEPDGIRREIAEVRALTARPFCVNLFARTEGALQGTVQSASALLAPYRAELGLPIDPPTPRGLPSLDEQLEVVADARVAALSFTLGALTTHWVERLQRAGVVVMGTATNVREAKLLEETGVDVIIAQGAEAGGHRGTFATTTERGLVGTMALVPQIVDAVKLPVIAAGGIFDGRGIAAAAALGAVASQIGTAFLVADEAGTNATHRRALAEARDESTTLTHAYSGKPARGLANAFIEALEPRRTELAPFPIQGDLTRDLRAEASRRGRPDLACHWAGQGVGGVRPGSAADLMRAWMEQARSAAARAAR